MKPGCVIRIRALTLHPEWVPAFALMGKRVENRTWRPPNALLAERLALHAGVDWPGAKSKRWLTFAAMAAALGYTVEHGKDGRMRVDGPDLGGFHDVQVPLGDIFATCKVIDVRSIQHLNPVPRWAFGPWCWMLDDYRGCINHAYRGHQGLWWAEL